MADRPVFLSGGEASNLVDEVRIEFKWHPGFSAIQKKKNVVGLHEAAQKKGLSPLLEVSTKSEIELGRRLSAFSLKIPTEIGDISIEAAYQGSKIFSKGGAYKDIYCMDSWSAKKDERLRSSGEIIGFDFFGTKWPLEPRTAFYDWLYLSALSPHQSYLRKLFQFKGFTDIEFNPKRSVNCQARACALLVSLMKLEALDNALRSQDEFISTIASSSFEENPFTDQGQRSLL